MGWDEPVLPYGSPSDNDDASSADSSRSLRAPSSNGRIIFGNFGEDDNIPPSPPPPGARVPILFGSLRPEDIPWRTDSQPRNLNRGGGGWWV